MEADGKPKRKKMNFKDYNFYEIRVTNNMFEKCVNIDQENGGGLRTFKQRRLVWPMLYYVSYRFCQDIKRLIKRLQLLEANPQETAEGDKRTIFFDSNRFNSLLYKATDLHHDVESSDSDDLIDEGYSEIYTSKDKFPQHLYIVLCAVFEIMGDMHYCQGFHDVATVLLLNVGPINAVAILCNLANGPMKNVLSKDLNKTMSTLKYIPDIVRTYDRDLARFLSKSKIDYVFALPWIITWFSHNVSCLGIASRLFDFFLVTNKHMPLYVAASVLLSAREEILQQECEFTVLHKYFTELPLKIDRLDWEKILSNSLNIIEDLPPQELFACNTMAGYLKYNVSQKMSKTFRLRNHPPGMNKHFYSKRFQKRLPPANNTYKYNKGDYRARSSRRTLFLQTFVFGFAAAGFVAVASFLIPKSPGFVSWIFNLFRK